MFSLTNEKITGRVKVFPIVVGLNTRGSLTISSIQEDSFKIFLNPNGLTARNINPATTPVEEGGCSK
jgi:hypothetical protein